MIRNFFWTDEPVAAPDIQDLPIPQQESIKQAFNKTLQLQLEMQEKEDSNENTSKLS